MVEIWAGLSNYSFWNKKRKNTYNTVILFVYEKTRRGNKTWLKD